MGQARQPAGSGTSSRATLQRATDTARTSKSAMPTSVSTSSRIRRGPFIAGTKLAHTHERERQLEVSCYASSEVLDRQTFTALLERQQNAFSVGRAPEDGCHTDPPQ